jgi:nucleoside phosphorylase/CheY-like chemotaxis protein
MIKILLTEDEPEKKRVIVEQIISVEGISLSNIDFAVDALEAKRFLSKNKYDLLILDINLPLKAGEGVEPGGGLTVLDFVKRNIKAIKPSYIVGMSAYQDGISAAEAEFTSPLWKLISFSLSDMSWARALIGAIEYLVENNKPPYVCDGSTFHTDLAIFVALEGEELASILALDAGWQKVDVPHDFTRYHVGKFKSADKELSVVVAAAPRMGMPPAAVIATKLINSFRPKYLAITGICAGVRSKVKMGDILIADALFDWGSGKWAKSLKAPAIFLPASYQWRLDQQLRADLKEFSEGYVGLAEHYENYPNKKPKTAPTTHIEVMASGAAVLQSAEHVSAIRALHKNLIGIEMESYAVFTAAEYSSNPKPKCISIKSVCDFGDDKKSDGFHEFSAYISAKFLQDFALSCLEPVHDLRAYDS